MSTELEKARKQFQLKKIEFEEKLKKLSQNKEMSEKERDAAIKPSRDANQSARKFLVEKELSVGKSETKDLPTKHWWKFW